jgi:hypothetical protein
VSFIRLETSFYGNPKVRALGNTQLARIARDLYVGALFYSREHLTDGFVPLAALPELDPITPFKDVERAAIALHSVGLFTRKRGRFIGYWINDYSKHQQTKEEVEQAREQAKDRKRKERERRRAVDASLSDTPAGHAVTRTPVTRIEESREEKDQKQYGLPISFDKGLELKRVLDACRGGDEGSMGVLTAEAQGVTLAGICRVRESCERKRPRPGVGYAVQALRSERAAA